LGLFGDPAGDWTRTAYALGLPLCPTLPGFSSYEESVHAMQRKLGPPTGQGGHPDNAWISGERRGVCFVAGGRTVVRQTQEGTEREHFTLWIAEIDPPLWMGLNCTFKKGGVLAKLFDVQSSTMNAWDPPRLQQLLSMRMNDGYDPWDVIGHAYDGGLKVELDDHAVRFERDGYALHPNTVGPALDGVTMIAERLKAARARLGPAPWEIDAANAWTPFASRFTLKLDRDRLRVHGVLEACKVDVRILGGAQPRTQLRVRFPNPLGIGLSLTQGRVSGLGKFFGVQDIELGDPAFDPVFVVKGGPEPVVRQVVHAQMRQELLAFANRGARVAVSDDRLEAWLPGILLQGRELDELLLRGMAVVRGFWRR
jgi:hypothetical protein